MKKTIMIFMLILSVMMSTQTGAQCSLGNVSSQAVTQHPFGAESEYDSEETVTFIVEMEGEPVLPKINLSQTTKSSTAVREKDEQMYRNEILRSHRAATDVINSELSEDIKPKYTYTEIFNGFAIDAKYGDLEVIEGAKGVKAVYVAQKTVADIRVGNASSMTHSLPSETMGYTGAGQVIAVLDSEFDVEHVAFSHEPPTPKYTKQELSDIFSKTEFNAPNIVNKVYENAKVPFRYDYGEDDTDTYASIKIHGTHVAGIAAGNSGDGDFLGVAPDAQLVLMKVADSQGVLKEETIMASLDDAAKLGVCVINCSFGWDYRSVDTYPVALTASYENAYKAGIFLSVASGNQGRGFYGAQAETVNIDDSCTGTPNALECAFSIGSVENTGYEIDVLEFTLHDGSVFDGVPMFEYTEQLTAAPYEYCKLGYPEDFEGLDLTGKFAVVDRGEIGFAIKANNAKAVGAVGIIIINTDEEYITTETLSLPAVCVPSSFGKLIKNAEVKTITSVSSFVPKFVENDMVTSIFSSYGTTETLGLKPDISAPGGNICSTLPDDKYGIMSGTSMSAPHISGVVAIISQYLDDTGCTVSLAERPELIGNMMMSTADVVYMVSEDEANQVPYSPRAQGAGLVNTANAIKTPVILYGDSGKTKLELGDKMTDTIDISFTAQNLTENDVVYDKMSAITLTDGYVSDNGKNYISDARLLKSELVTDFDTVVVPANSSVKVSAQIKLDIDELNENYLVFQNGFYIDGFLRLESTTSEVVSVGMPFMGFFGDWTQAPIFDKTLYDDGGSTLVYDARGINGSYLYSYQGERAIILGYDEESATFNVDKIAISPDGDGCTDNIGVQIVPMRSIRDLSILVTDTDGNHIDTDSVPFLSKFIPSYGTVEITEDMPDGIYYIKLEGYMNYDTENPTKQSMSIPFRVDRQKSVIKSCKLEGNTVIIDIYDPAGISHINIMDTETGEEAELYWDSYVADDRITYEFEDNATPELSNIKLDITDNTLTVSSYFLGGFDGKIGAHISEIFADEKSYDITFDFSGDAEFSDASLILAFFDENGEVMHTDMMENQLVSSGKYKFSGDFDVYSAHKCKLFIWDDTETISPLDTVKVFDIAKLK